MSAIDTIARCDATIARGAALRVYLDAADDHAHDAITVALAEALAAWTANAKRAP